MKILFLVSDLSAIGGIQQYNKNVLRSLSEADSNFKVVELKRSTIFNKTLFVIQAIFQHLFFHSDIVFCGHINFYPICLFLNRFFSTKYIIFTHGIDVWDIQEKRKKNALIKSEKVITVSRFTKQKLIEQVPELKNKVFLLSNAVDGDRFYPKEKPYKLIDKYNLRGKRVIFTLARLSKGEGDKGYDQIIKALPQVLKKIPNAIYLLSGKGNDLPRIKEIITRLKLEKDVILTGFIPEEDKIDYYNLADVFIMPSKKEGFGIVFLEALACGKPVIAGNQDGSRDAVLDGKLGVLVNPDDVNEITEAIISVLQKKTSNNLLNSETLRRDVLKVFGISVFKKRVLLLLNELQE